ncbi:pilin N-terminal domain-containing protein [Enterococcus gilvus]|uniref:pilin N-terminal domain-containing protein n=1 Tax=Enterococcus gilvus TaxID=160453 RepID=UPI0028D6ECF5|nr:pilin N-terminal domain-containing protein [Enterococcus gilvus]
MKKILFCLVLIGSFLTLSPLVHADQINKTTNEPAGSTQTLHIQKIVNQSVRDNQGKQVTQTEGINGAHFTVYDVTKLYEAIRKEHSQKQQSSVDLTQTLLKRAQKQDVQTLPVTFEGTTAAKDGQAGILTGTLPIDANKPKAYYVVNDQADNASTTSQDSVVITPMSDDQGNVNKDIWLYPKAEQPKKETREIVSTGVTPAWTVRVRHFFVSLLSSTL